MITCDKCQKEYKDTSYLEKYAASDIDAEMDNFDLLTPCCSSVEWTMQAIKNIRLEYFNGKKWVLCGTWVSEKFAWISLGGDDRNYRTVNIATGKVLIDKS